MDIKLVSVVALCGVTAIACGDDTTGSGGSGGSGGSTTSTVTTSATTTSTSTGMLAPACYDNTAGLVIDDTAIPNAAVGQNVCDATQIADLLTECFDPGTEMTCDAYMMANPACADCLLGAEMAPFPLPVLLGSDNNTYLSVFACQAMAMSLPQCAVQVESLVFCAYTSCEGCAASEEDACLDYALNDETACAGAIPIDAACNPVFEAAAFDPKCDGADFDAAYANVATYFCGPAL